MGKCCCLVFILIVAMVVVGVSIGVPLAVKKAKQTASDVKQGATEAACQATSYPTTCNETLAGGNYTADSKGVTKMSLVGADSGVSSTLSYVQSLNAGGDANVTAAVAVCVEVLGLSKERIEAAMARLDASNATTRGEVMDDIKAWVSGAMELHTTCIDAFLEISPANGRLLQQHANHTDELFSNALALINAFAAYGEDLLQWKPTGFSLPSNFDFSDLPSRIPPIPGLGNRKLLSSRSDWVTESDTAPGWMDAQTQRHLLQASPYDVVVAQDGSGSYKTIQAAVDAHSENNQRLVIYVKAGTYNEQVIIPKTAKFLTIVGDGDLTVITGSRSVALTKGMTTFKSATLIVQGEGFIGKYFKVENTAGAEGHQACAFRGTADKISFQKVTFDSFQDTMYVHSFRQFFRECTVSGTVDFMFGNAAAAFQNCYILAKKTTLLGQQNTYSAQGRTDAHQNTGLAFQNCTFDGVADLKTNTTYYKTYLGRPWKVYSVCVIMKSQLMSHIDPAGWLAWNTSDFGLYTSYFGEYANTGPRSDTSQRVKWSYQIGSVSANKYQANNFVQASSWVTVPLTTAL